MAISMGRLHERDVPVLHGDDQRRADARVGEDVLGDDDPAISPCRFWARICTLGGRAFQPVARSNGARRARSRAVCTYSVCSTSSMPARTIRMPAARLASKSVAIGRIQLGRAVQGLASGADDRDPEAAGRRPTKKMRRAASDHELG